MAKTMLVYGDITINTDGLTNDQKFALVQAIDQLVTDAHGSMNADNKARVRLHISTLLIPGVL